MTAETEQLLADVLVELFVFLRASNRAREREEHTERVTRSLEGRGYSVRDRR